MYDRDLFIFKLSVYYNKPIEYFKQWKYLILNVLKLDLKNASFLVLYKNLCFLKIWKL